MLQKYNPAGYFGLILVMIFSGCFVFYTFGLDFIAGSSSYWAMERTDVTQHVSGIAMYLSSPWKFPLLAFDSLNYPEGTRVTFIDGIPIYALLLKIFLPKNMGFFNPLGYWVALCFFLQGFSAWWISKELGVKSWLVLIFLAIMFLTYPPLIMRLKHVSLLSHWILLFAIALYLRGNRSNHLPVLRWTIFLMVAFYVNIYLFAMALGIYLVTLLELKIQLTAKKITLFFLPILFLVPSLFIFLLPLPPVSLIKEMGFDIYGMSIFSPIIGGKIIQWQVDTTLGQRDEGFCYLGLGVLASFLYIIVIQYNQCLMIIKKHKPFFALMLIYYIYSLSNHVYFGSKLVAIIDYPQFFDFITGEFRCSGRFFWPVGYAIIIFTVYMLHRQLNKHTFHVFICTALVIQLIDLSDCYKNEKAHMHFHPPHVLNYAALDKILGKKVKYIYFYPKYKCTIDDPYRNNILLPVMRYVAIRHLNMNTGYIARYKPACDNVAAEIYSSDHLQSAYIFDKKSYPTMQMATDMMGDSPGIFCQELELIYVCKF